MADTKLSPKKTWIPISVAIALMLGIFNVAKDYSLVKTAAISGDTRSYQNEQNISNMKEDLADRLGRIETLLQEISKK